MDTPTGWASKRHVERRPCPICHNAIEVTKNTANLRVLADHTRQVPGEYGRSHCFGSGRLVSGGSR